MKQGGSKAQTGVDTTRGESNGDRGGGRRHSLEAHRGIELLLKQQPKQPVGSMQHPVDTNCEFKKPVTTQAWGGEGAGTTINR